MKKVFSIVAGVTTGFVIVFMGDASTHALHPVPLGLNYMDKNVMLDYIATIPTYIRVIMMAFWLLSSFFGGMVSARLYRAEWKKSALTTGCILMAASLLNLIMTTPAHPTWMWIGALAGYIPLAFIGGWLVKEKAGNLQTNNT